MANEKNWHYTHNQDTDGADDAATAQNWMYTFYTFLSGGANPGFDPSGAALAAWEIISASNATTVVAGDVGWTGPSDITFNTAGSAHSWFVARKPILPSSSAQQGDGTGSYVWLTVDCENANDEYAWFGFQHTEPNFAQANPDKNRPTEAAQTYYKDTLYRYPYDAGQVSWFNGIMDETGSFVIWSSRNYAGQQNYPFSLACLRLETPRIGDVDPYPLFMKCAWHTNASNAPHGTWDASNYYYNTTNNGQYDNYARWGQVGGQGLWRASDGNADLTYGHYCQILRYGVAGPGNGWAPQQNMDSEGSDLDGTYPRLPCFVAANRNSSATEVRGRIPDITTSVNGSLTGLVTPQTGSITACMIGDFFFPATASMLPGI